MLTSNQNKEIFFLLLLLNFDPECVKRSLLML